MLRCALLTTLACSGLGSPEQPVHAPGRALYVPQMAVPKVPQPKMTQVQQMPGLPVEGAPQEPQATLPVAPAAPFNGAPMTPPSMMAPGAMFVQAAPSDAAPMQPIGKEHANTLSGFFGGLAAGFAAVAAVVYATMKQGVETQAMEINDVESARMQLVTMQFNFGRASPTKPIVKKDAKPLSPGSNYPTTKNIQTQRSGFGSFLQKFQKSDGKSKYGMPIFDKNGNVNPAYLAAERKEMAAQKKRNITEAEKKRKGLIAAGQFELADYIRKKIGEVGSGKEYYESGR